MGGKVWLTKDLYGVNFEDFLSSNEPRKIRCEMIALHAQGLNRRSVNLINTLWCNNFGTLNVDCPTARSVSEKRMNNVVVQQNINFLGN